MRPPESLLITLAETSPAVFLRQPLTAESIPFEARDYALSIERIITYGTEKPIRIHRFVLKDDGSHDNIMDNDGTKICGEVNNDQDPTRRLA
jgi:hypothetical protein